MVVRFSMTYVAFYFFRYALGHYHFAQNILCWGEQYSQTQDWWGVPSPRQILVNNKIKVG